MKTNGIPLWITLVLAVLAVAGAAAGLMAMAGNGFETFMNPAWGGRGLGMAIMAGAVIVVKDLFAYVALFVASIAREMADLLQLAQAETFNVGLGVPAIVLLVVWGVGLVYAATAWRANEVTR